MSATQNQLQQSFNFPINQSLNISNHTNSLASNIEPTPLYSYSQQSYPYHRQDHGAENIYNSPIRKIPQQYINSSITGQYPIMNTPQQENRLNQYSERVQSNYHNRQQLETSLFFAGASHQYSLIGGCGWWVANENSVICYGSAPVQQGFPSPLRLEYEALLNGLHAALKRSVKRINIKGCSDYILTNVAKDYVSEGISAIDEYFHVTNYMIKDLHSAIIKALKSFHSVTFEQISSVINTDAQRLAEKAMNGLGLAEEKLSTLKEMTSPKAASKEATSPVKPTMMPSHTHMNSQTSANLKLKLPTSMLTPLQTSFHTSNSYMPPPHVRSPKRQSSQSYLPVSQPLPAQNLPYSYEQQSNSNNSNVHKFQQQQQQYQAFHSPVYNYNQIQIPSQQSQIQTNWHAQIPQSNYNLVTPIQSPLRGSSQFSPTPHCNANPTSNANTSLSPVPNHFYNQSFPYTPTRDNHHYQQPEYSQYTPFMSPSTRSNFYSVPSTPQPQSLPVSISNHSNWNSEMTYNYDDPDTIEPNMRVIPKGLFDDDTDNGSSYAPEYIGVIGPKQKTNTNTNTGSMPSPNTAVALIESLEMPSMTQLNSPSRNFEFCTVSGSFSTQSQSQSLFST